MRHRLALRFGRPVPEAGLPNDRHDLVEGRACLEVNKLHRDGAFTGKIGTAEVTWQDDTFELTIAATDKGLILTQTLMSRARSATASPSSGPPAASVAVARGSAAPTPDATGASGGSCWPARPRALPTCADAAQISATNRRGRRCTVALRFEPLASPPVSAATRAACAWRGGVPAATARHASHHVRASRCEAAGDRTHYVASFSTLACRSFRSARMEGGDGAPSEGRAVRLVRHSSWRGSIFLLLCL